MQAVYDLDKSLFKLKRGNDNFDYTIRMAVTGISVFGNTGSGKSSGSGAFIARKYLEAGFGGLVLATKVSEKEVWETYCKETGRLNDLLIISPGCGHSFNFLNYEAQNKPGGISLTQNILLVLQTVIKASEEKKGQRDSDRFWEMALSMLVTNVIDLCLLAYDKLSVQLMYSIFSTAPKAETKISDKSKYGTYAHAYNAAQANILAQIADMPEAKTAVTTDDIESIALEKLPDASLLKSIDEYFIDNYRTINPKTRAIIEQYFLGLLHKLLREPARSLFCNNTSTFSPDDSLKGKIILLDLPVKLFDEVGRDLQILFKVVWQRAMERRNIQENNRPVFLWCDEAQEFTHPKDAEFQMTARSSLVSVVSLTQNLPNYYMKMGGDRYEHTVKTFLSTLSTKIFHCNNDVQTNEYGAALIGKGYEEDSSKTVTIGQDFSTSETNKYELGDMFRSEEFSYLKTGGPKNNFLVEAIIHLQDGRFKNGFNYCKAAFKQSQ